MSNKPNVDDYLQQGIYGQKEINPAEKRKYLGTFRERIVIALTRSQVREKEPYQEVVDSMKEHSQAKLLLNGNMEYFYLSKYIKLANKANIPFTIVTDKEHSTEIGLILAYDYAIDKEEICVEKKKKINHQVVTNKISTNKKSLFSKMKNKLFH